jgi:hypothetical protein
MYIEVAKFVVDTCLQVLLSHTSEPACLTAFVWLHSVRRHEKEMPGLINSSERLSQSLTSRCAASTACAWVVPKVWWGFGLPKQVVGGRQTSRLVLPEGTRQMLKSICLDGSWATYRDSILCVA